MKSVCLTAAANRSAAMPEAADGAGQVHTAPADRATAGSAAATAAAANAHVSEERGGDRFSDDHAPALRPGRAFMSLNDLIGDGHISDMVGLRVLG
jgi:hypothetical protein